MRVISVSDEGEFGLITRIAARFPHTPDVLLGPGDDGAVIAAADGRVVVSTDLMVEGRHFRRDWSTAYDVGRKSAASNLADIVAMGARPTALVVGLATPGDLPVEWAEGMADGLRDECARVGATVAGGDVVASDTLLIAVTALGDLEGRAPITRSGARIGDTIHLIGFPGRAAGGLAWLEAGELDHPLADAHRRPEPDYDLALAVSRSGAVTSMTDVSDGLLADLGHIASASGFGYTLDHGAIPVAPDLAAAFAGDDLLDLILTGGDDHCFVLTAPPGAVDLPVIGSIANFVHMPMREAGFEHFRQGRS